MKTWKGRFNAPLDPEALTFSSSLPVDKRLYREDIDGSLSHTMMLARQKIISVADARKIRRALLQIRREIDSGKFRWSRGRFAAEDIHMAIENRLITKLGEAGRKLHAGRSRNDQIALDERLYLRNTIASIRSTIRRFQKTLVGISKRYDTVLMPGYTHLQRAQPVLLAHHLLAYVAMLDRDAARFADCHARVNRSPLGAAALAGTSLPIDREFVARSLSFNGLVENSMDAVSDRDVQIEFLSACAIVMMHASRLAEELVLWSSREWRFVRIGDAFATGSSIMPQKKNPDMAELVRGKCGRVYGNLMTLLTVMKGLPLAYNRDMQEDKEPLFDSADTVLQSLHVLASMMKTVRFDRTRFEQELNGDLLLATDLAEYLVRKGVPFRKAHGIVGSIVRKCAEKGIDLPGISLNEYRKFSPVFSDDLYGILNPRRSLSLKKSAGSTSPSNVRRSIRSWQNRLRNAS